MKLVISGASRGPDDESPEENLLKREGTSIVGQALHYLSDQEQVVIRHRFGLDGCPILTLKEIGEKMGVSRERVRQIETKAKQRLRRIFNRPRPAAAKPAKVNRPAKAKGSKHRT